MVLKDQYIKIERLLQKSDQIIRSSVRPSLDILEKLNNDSTYSHMR